MRITKPGRSTVASTATLLAFSFLAGPAPAQMELQKLTAASPAAAEELGNAVSASGDLAAAGAWISNGGNGAVEIFRNVAGTWTREARLVPPAGFLGSNDFILFGTDVSVSSSPAGEVVAIGAPFDYGDPLWGSTVQDALWTGAVYVFRQAGGSWQFEQKLVPSDGGDTVGAAENLIVAGCSQDDVRALGGGSVYVYRYHPALPAGQRWVEEATALCPPQVQHNQQFGEDVNVDVNNGVERLIGGAGAHSTGTALETVESAFVYRYVGGTWQLEAGGALTPPGAGLGDHTFVTTALHGNLAVVGTSGRDVGGDDAVGAAWVFRFDGAAWNLEQQLLASDGAAGDSFGREMSVRGDLILVAAPWDDRVAGGNYGTGADYLFRFDGTTWHEEAKLRGLDTGVNDGFANPAITGDMAIIGALDHDVVVGANTYADAGAAYVFELLNSPAGGNVTVQPVDAVTNAAPATLAFANITTPGTTTVDVSDQGPPPPTGFKLGTPETYYEIATSAAYSGSITICIRYTGISFDDESKLRLLHHENGDWIDVTTTLDVANDLICGSVSSLSPFLVAEQAKLDVVVDIKPGSYPNSINLGSKGNVPVAILSTATFDATTVDPLTVTLANAAVSVRGNGTAQAEFVDVNGDGLLDLKMQVDTRALDLTEGDTEALLAGRTFGGQEIEGSDSVRVVK